MAFTRTQPFEHVRATEDLNADASRVALFDADGDGDLDVISGSAPWRVEGRSFPLLLNDGEGGLSDATEAHFGATIPAVNRPLYHDGDGLGGMGAVQIALLAGAASPALAAEDIVIAG